MKIAVFTDVHGNLPALQAVLDAIGRQGYDLIVHLGDAVGIGPFPAECLHILLDCPRMRFVMGNHDAWFAHGLPDPQPEWMSDGEVIHQQWIHSQIGPELCNVLATWPYLVQDEWQGVSVSFLHYAMTSCSHDFAPIIQDSSVTHLDNLFGHLNSELVFYGHHHPFSDMTGQARYVNPGSLGCYHAPVARYTMVTCTQAGFDVEHCRVSYEDSQLFVAFEARQVPEREFLYKAFFGGRYPNSQATYYVI